MAGTNRKISKLNSGIEIYFEFLRDLNISYQKLSSISCIKNPIKFKKQFCYFIQNINKVIPWTVEKNKKTIKLSPCDAIMSYSKDFDFLLNDMRIIFENNKDLLNNIRIIRNGLEHSPHEIIIEEMFSGSGISAIIFIRKKERYIIRSVKMKSLLLELNTLFKKIIDYIETNIDNYPKEFKKSYTFKYLKKYNNKVLGDINGKQFIKR